MNSFNYSKLFKISVIALAVSAFSINGVAAGATHAQNLRFNNGHPDNSFSRANMHNATNWNHQFTRNFHNSGMMHTVNSYQNYYNQHYYNNNFNRFNAYNNYWRNPYYGNWYGGWYGYGFYNPFWYPFYPDFLIARLFVYPTILWFYADQLPIENAYSGYTVMYNHFVNYINNDNAAGSFVLNYSRAYYPKESKPSIQCLGAFPYRHVFFPTTIFRDLLVEVSALPQNLRCNFKSAMVFLTLQLQSQVIVHFNAVNFKFNNNDIAINYYQNLQNKVIVVAGLASQDNIHMAFEALIDLNNPDHVIVFAPKGQTPTPDQLKVLESIKDKIKSLGGETLPSSEAKPSETNQTIQPQAELITRENLLKSANKASNASLKKTALKMGVSFWDYLIDRTSNKYTIPSLDQLVLAMAS